MIMIRGVFTLIVSLWATITLASEIELAGRWQVELKDGSGRIAMVSLPGSLATNGIGDKVTLSTPWTGQIVDSAWFNEDRYAKYRSDENLKIPAWLQPTSYYKGEAIYSRTFKVCGELAGKKFILALERPHWHSSVKIDGKGYGSENSLGTPHRYVVGPLSEGEHTIEISIDNSMKGIDVGRNAHSISDHTQSNWNGIVGEISLSPISSSYISKSVITPNPKEGYAEVKLHITSSEAKSSKITLQAESKYAPTSHKP